MDNNYIVHEGHKYVNADDHEQLKRKYQMALNENAELRHRSEIDPLTKVYRRAAAIEKINDFLHGGIVSCAFIVFDLDNFKYINDTFGHIYGDAIITTAAECMMAEVQKSGIIGRFGGDEFFIFMPDADADLAIKTAKNIIIRISEYGNQTDVTQSLSCSAGVAIGEGNVTYNSLFSMADKALYMAKLNGKARAELFNYADMNAINKACITYCDKDEFNKNPHSNLVARSIEMASKAGTTDDAVQLMFSQISMHFGMQRIKILGVDLAKDMITVVYDYKKSSDITSPRKNNVGYYLHKDLVHFRDAMPDRKVVCMENIDISEYSEKFQKEFRDNDQYHHLYYINKTDDGNYTICFFEAAGPVKFWGEDDCKAIGDLSAIVMVYADKVRHVSKREQALQDRLDIDKVTRIFTMEHFYEESGLIRKLAFENDAHCYLIAINPLEFVSFNRRYTYDDGDELLRSYAQSFENSEYKSMGIIAHDKARFYILIRTPEEIDKVKEAVYSKVHGFIDNNKDKYPDYKFRFSVGVIEVFQNEILFWKIDDAEYAGIIIE